MWDDQEARMRGGSCDVGFGADTSVEARLSRKVAEHFKIKLV